MNVMTVYRTLRRLVDRGLIGQRSVNRKERSYRPLSLKKLIEKLAADERKIRRLQAGLAGVDRLLPYLNLEDRKGDEPEPI
jgi:sugar-specific transcriptional regulator TrmB